MSISSRALSRVLILLSIVISAFVFNNAFAQNFTLTWQEPVEREDDSALPRSEISHFKARDANTNDIVIDNIGGELNAFTFNFPKGSYIIGMTAVDTEGRESIFSPVVSFVSQTDLATLPIIVTPPKQPQQVIITITVDVETTP